MTNIWLGLFFGSLAGMLLLLLVRSMRIKKHLPELDYVPNKPTWYHPHLPAHILHIISPRTIVRILSFGLFVCVTVLEELLERVVNKLKKLSKKLVTSINSIERKHHKKYSNINSQKASFQEEFKKYSQNE